MPSKSFVPLLRAGTPFTRQERGEGAAVSTVYVHLLRLVYFCVWESVFMRRGRLHTFIFNFASFSFSSARLHEL